MSLAVSLPSERSENYVSFRELIEDVLRTSDDLRDLIVDGNHSRINSMRNP
jgi:hypothetical protein